MERVRVRVREEARTNPAPAQQPVAILTQYITPQALMQLTGTDDLTQVTFIDLLVDTRSNSLGQFGSLLPNLQQLKLSNSIIPAARDLGTGLNNLTVLWMSRCGLEDIDGLTACIHLKELYLSYNAIRECRGVSLLDELQILDLEGNIIADYTQVAYAAMCLSLRSLTLEGNPVCLLLDENNKPYREATLSLVSRIQTLDGIARTAPTATAAPTDPSALRTDMNLGEGHLLENEVFRISENLRTRLDDESVLLQEGRPSTSTGRPGTATQRQLSSSAPPLSLSGTLTHRPSTSSSTSSSSSFPLANAVSSQSGQASAQTRPGSSRFEHRPLRPSSSQGRSLTTSSSTRPVTALRPTTASRGISIGSDDASLNEDIAGDDGSSSLTLGSAVTFCGNPLKALKARRQDQDEPSSISPAELQELLATVGLTMSELKLEALTSTSSRPSTAMPSNRPLTAPPSALEVTPQSLSVVGVDPNLLSELDQFKLSFQKVSEELARLPTAARSHEETFDDFYVPPEAESYDYSEDAEVEVIDHSPIASSPTADFEGPDPHAEQPLPQGPTAAIPSTALPTEQFRPQPLPGAPTRAPRRMPVPPGVPPSASGLTTRSTPPTRITSAVSASVSSSVPRAASATTSALPEAAASSSLSAAAESKRRVLPLPPGASSARVLPTPPSDDSRPKSSASSRLRAARQFAQSAM
eukprot:m.579544 g.579544  ORF g.579544 m.579544 type:complete len:697 (+) comp57926_c0_seq25:70-2160(+)